MRSKCSFAALLNDHGGKGMHRPEPQCFPLFTLVKYSLNGVYHAKFVSPVEREIPSLGEARNQSVWSQINCRLNKEFGFPGIVTAMPTSFKNPKPKLIDQEHLWVTTRPSFFSPSISNLIV